MDIRQDRKALIESAEKYLEAGRKGNIDLMKEVFHIDATIFGYFEGKFLGGPIQLLYDWMKSFGAAPNIDGQVVSADLEGTIGNVKVQAKDWCGYNFTDYLNFFKIDGKWVIINKMFFHN
ncbi:MAG: nuclear transport factor 2 family protein [Thermodesulfobacteriota bacterium]